MPPRASSGLRLTSKGFIFPIWRQKCFSSTPVQSSDKDNVPKCEHHLPSHLSGLRRRTDKIKALLKSNSPAYPASKANSDSRSPQDTLTSSLNSSAFPERDNLSAASSGRHINGAASPDEAPSKYPASFRQLHRRTSTGLPASGLPTIDAKQARLIEAQLFRSVRYGDIYAPHDLSANEQLKAKYARGSRNSANRKPNTRKKGSPDDLDTLAINPIKHYKNFSMMSEFMSEIGRIKHGRDTGFRAVNQRRMAKAVRRAIGIGIMPSVHKHPELFGDRISQRSQISARSSLSGLRSFF